MEHPECEGEEAFLRIVEANPRAFKFKIQAVESKTNVNISTTELLLSCMQELDERDFTAGGGELEKG